MTDEELAEEWLDERYLKDMGVRKPCKQAFLAGLKAGSQLDKVWHEYDAGEDCYEDSHEGRWVEREDNKPEWHKVADGDLPKEHEYVLVYTDLANYYVSERVNDHFMTKGFGFIPTSTVIAWCEIPTYKEE